MDKNTAKLELIRLRAEGKSFREIAEKLSLSKPTIIKWSRELSVEISNQQRLEYEAFLKNLEFTRENRAKKLKALSQKLEAELQNRDLSDLPTGKLIDQLVRIYDDWDINPDISFESKEMNFDLSLRSFDEDDKEL